jgi:DNA modification methylase
MSTWVENLHEAASFGYPDKNRWPAEFSHTSHRLVQRDARDLAFLPDASVHLVVTSPPYWTLKEYLPNEQQLGAIEDYEAFSFRARQSLV